MIIGASSHDDDFVIVVGVIWAYDNNNFSPDDPDQSYSEYFSNGGGFSFVVGDITTAQHTRHVFGATHSIVESGGPIGEFFIPLYEASDAYVQELIETGIWAGTVAATSVPPARSEQAQSV